MTSTSAAIASVGRETRDGRSANPARRSRSGPRDATQPAQISAGIALPGTNHVQSIAEWTPNTITTLASATSPTRSASHGKPRDFHHTPTLRAAATSHVSATSADSPSPSQPMSDSVCTT